MSAALQDCPMAKKTTSVRLTEEAMKLARIAAGYTGESITEYVSRVVEASAQADIDKGHAELAREKKATEGKPPKR